MVEACARHPGARATGVCDTCHRPLCPACRVEDVATERVTCSEACRAAARAPAPSASASNDALVESLRRPIVGGWRLWARQAGPLTLQVGLPLGLTFGLFDLATGGAGPSSTEATEANPADLGLLVCVPLGAAAVAVLLARAHTGAGAGSPWPQVAARFVPWATAWLLVMVSVLVGLLLLVVPGLVAGIRLFWADEFALIHGRGPLAALRESKQLTEGLTGRVFGFQFTLGVAQYLVLVPLVIGLFAVGFVGALLPEGPVTALFRSVAGAVVLVQVYAGLHAPEVVYFYGLRALRAELAPEDLHGDWVARGLFRRTGSDGAPVDESP